VWLTAHDLENSKRGSMRPTSDVTPKKERKKERERKKARKKERKKGPIQGSMKFDPRPNTSHARTHAHTHTSILISFSNPRLCLPSDILTDFPAKNSICINRFPYFKYVPVPYEYFQPSSLNN